MKNTPSTITQQVVNEHRKYIQDNLVDVLEVADFIFERGHLTRAECRDIEAVEGKSDRSAAFIDLLATKEDEVLDVLIQYLAEKSKDGSGDNVSGSSSCSILHEKLKLSREKFSNRDFNGNRMDKEKMNITPTNLTTIIDSADFTMTHKSLDEVRKNIILRSEKARRNWATVISNMNGLGNLELFLVTGGDDESQDDLNLKMRLRIKENPVPHSQLDLDGNALDLDSGDCTNWDEIVGRCFSLWKEKNGNNATFFSLVGIFQESQLTEIADLLLVMKDDIQKCKLGQFKDIWNVNV